MSKFIKVAKWHGNESYHFQNDPDILYINTDCVKKFYRESMTNGFNFKPYFEGDQILLNYYYHPTKIITKDGDVYYSPIDLHDSTKLDIETVESRFDIIDL